MKEIRLSYPQLKYEVRLNLIDYPNYYRIVMEYFYSGLEDLSINVEFRDSDQQLVGIGRFYCVIINNLG